MRWLKFVAIVSLVAALPSTFAAAPGPKPHGGDLAVEDIDHDLPGYLIILATSRNFPRLLRQAQSISHKSHVPFNNLDRIFDPRRGLILPDNYVDDCLAGAYCFRRDHATEIRPGVESPFISIEKSSAYPGLKKGYYIIVADICFTRKDAAAALAKIRHVVPGAYAHKTTIYMGCIH